MSYRTILMPVGQPDNAESAMQAAFLVARRFGGHVHALHVVPDLADPATHALIATRMSLEAASSDLRALAEARVDVLLAQPADPAIRGEVVETMARIDPAAYRIGAEAVWLADQRDRSGF